MKTFSEEQLAVELVLCDGVLEHCLRIDRVLRQPLGHVLLVGESGAGKTTLSRFVAWMNGMTVFQVKTSHSYTLEDFDNDLRGVMWAAGVNGDQVAFIFDESNVLSSAFLEKMNALLASGEVPGLFEGDEWTKLQRQLGSAAHKEGVAVSGEDETYEFFIGQIRKNLHVIFTMNPGSADFDNRTATSPALFNRCVVDWVGDWTPLAFSQ
ncbi:DHC-8, partial [Symbiodinium sp. KB8]